MGDTSDTSMALAEAERLMDLVNGKPENVPDALPHLLALLEHDDPEVLETAIIGVSFAHVDEATLEVLRFARHPDEDVRLAVSRAATSVEDLEVQRKVADVLIELTRDDKDDVRNWATFGLGQLQDLDYPALRDALAARLDDPHDETRGEAWVGLAKRGDDRAKPAVLTELARDDVIYLAVEAAMYYADERFLADLLELRPQWPTDDDTLDLAINSCDPEVRAATKAAMERLVDLVAVGFPDRDLEIDFKPDDGRHDMLVSWTAADGKRRDACWSFEYLLDAHGGREHVPTAAAAVLEHLQEQPA